MVAVLLFLGTWVGHCYLLMLTLNWLYAHPLHRTFLKLTRLACGGLLFAPPSVALLFGTDISGLLEDAFHQQASLLAACYVVWCLFLGIVAFPFATIVNQFRRNPPQVLSETTTTIDIAAELGHRPIGHGKHQRIAARSWNDLFRVDFTTFTVALPDWPAAWDGLNILHLSDLHFYGTLDQAYYQRVIEHCMQQGVPDLLIISGDIIDGQQYLDWIAPILGELQWKIAAFAILGNHDWWQDYDGVRLRLTQLGIHVLGNRQEVHTVRGEPLVVIGHEGPWFRPAPDMTATPEGYRLLISHTPDNINWARRHRIGLMLSGHNHGGQVRLPLIGSMFVPSKYSRRYDMGTFFRSPTFLHVNRGLGGKEPIRYRCHPQVTRLIVRPTAM